ncbi:hypothetical protein PI124_g16060 [Phytophthora idaei]|nr:hypothetical protein PI125_g16236 [Phytophthora idaei]KAG3150887.1 hypothetical protein PI126_g11271 [Phytophthora idaei]KAG3238989.1 hypothetical protein PI124_g16060 [Phytophthora idaei]
MDSTGAYDAGDSESWSSSEGEEQVIEISSHSRILISPRKTRSSAWNNNSQRIRNRRVSVGKRKPTQPQKDDPKSPSSQTNRHSFHELKSRKSCWAGSPRKTPADNQPVTSNNSDSVSGSESDENLASSRDGSDSSGDSDASLESDEETLELRRVSRKQGIKKNSSNSYKHLATSLDAPMQSLGSPTASGKEMEELKATLKKLARHDDSDDNPIMQKEPNISSATALHEYLTAATALIGVNTVTATNQTRPTESTRLKTRQASLHLPRSSSNISSGWTRNTKSMRATDSDAKVRRDSPSKKLAGSRADPGSERLSFNKKIFCAPPPPFGVSGTYAGLTLPLQKNSFTSGGGVSGGAQGSRAVLSALKALQDKIGRLEQERESLMQQLSDAKLIARKREAELATTDKKFSYELGQSKESARAAYDALHCDREELKLQLVRSEERREATQNELQHFQELAKNVSAKADDLQSRLQISESHRARLKAEMKESESDHKLVVQELQAELSHVRQDQQASVERNELLEAQLQRESTNHVKSRERLKDAEQTVASISQLNEKLVTKVMEATEAANKAMKKNKKLQQQIRPSTLLRPTAASRASAAAASEATARRATNSQGSTGAYQAKTLKKKKTATGTASSATKKPKKAKSVNNMTLLREANLGKEIPFLLGNSVQPSFSLIGNIQDALRRCDTTYVMPTLLSGTSTTPGSSSSHQQTPHTIYNSEATNREDNSPAAPDSPSPTNETVTTTAPLSSTPTATTGIQRHSAKQKPPAIEVSTASPKTYTSSMQTQIMEDLHAAFTSAEKELKKLNKRYKDLVAQMETNNRRRVSGSDDAKASTSSSAQLSQALGPLLDELEAKAKQLNLLKQVYQQAANSTINPQRHVVVSPAAVRRKTASLRVLNEYRQLESNSKNKGSGTSASP